MEEDGRFKQGTRKVNSLIIIEAKFMSSSDMLMTTWRGDSFQEPTVRVAAK